MPIFVVVIIRFVQALALMAVWAGLTNLPALFEYLQAIAKGQAWEQGELSKRILAATGPLVGGTWVVIGLQALLRHGKLLHERSVQFPNEPWLWRPEWAAKRIRLSNRTAILVSVVAMSLYLGIVVPAGFWMASIKLATGIYWFVGIFVAILFGFMRLLWLNRRWANSDLAISTLPGVLGGPFAGIVTIPEAFLDGTPFRVTLRCVEHRQSRSHRSKSSHSTDITIWQAQKVVSRSIPADRPDATALPCYFAIPYELPPSGAPSETSDGFVQVQPRTRSQIRWELSVAPKDETDVRRATFEIPVFKTAQSSPSYQEDEAIDRPFLEAVDVDALLARIAYRREETAHGERHTFSLFQWGIFLGISIFTLTVGAGTAAILYYVAVPLSLFAALIPGALTIAGAIAVVEMLTWRATIDVGPEGVRIAAGPFWSRPVVEIPPGTVPTLVCAEEYRRETGAAWCVRFVPEIGKPRPLVKRLDGKQEAAALRDWLKSRLAR